MKKRQSFDKAFKAKVALEALREEGASLMRTPFRKLPRNTAFIQTRLASGKSR
ncbi:MAG TPA: hypothetical protein PLG94_10500 [Smithellaceae bacterium]|jgi:hypothetical protein|nr:hypothetical protein [Smithellaceae bacterium]